MGLVVGWVSGGGLRSGSGYCGGVAESVNWNRFTIDRPIPPSTVNQNPVRIEFVNPDYLYGYLEDVRLLSADEQAHLHVTMLEGNSITGTVLDAGGRPVAEALIQAVFGTSLSDRQSARTDANGAFVVRGLPSKRVNLRVYSSLPALLQTGTADVDLSTPNRSTTIRVWPLAPPRAAVHQLLGMKLAETDPKLQTRLHLDHPAILVLDPGPDARRLGLELHAGDCFWAVDGKDLVTDVAGLSRFVARQFSEVDRGRPVRLVCGLQPWGDDVTITSKWDKLQLTDEDLEALRKPGR